VHTNFYRYLTSLEPLLYKGVQCRSPVSNPKAELKIQVLGSRKNVAFALGMDSFHFCSVQTLLQTSGCLTAYLPEKRLSCWPIQIFFFAHLAVCLCLLIRCGTVVVASLPALDRGTARTCGSVQKATALLTICHYMSHKIIVIFQAV